MASLSTMPDEILRAIFAELKSAADGPENDPSFFTLTYVCTRFRTCALELLHNQNSSNWTKKTRTRRMATLRKAEALKLFERFARTLFCCGWCCRPGHEEKIFKAENFTRADRVHQHLTAFFETTHKLCDRAWRAEIVKQDNELERRLWKAFETHHCQWD